MGSASAIMKVVAGLAITGGVLATSLLVSGNSIQVETDRGKFHLGRNFQGCTTLLSEPSSSGKNDGQIYLCPFDENNKLEMIYFQEVNGGKDATKIKELRQNFHHQLRHELIIRLEDNSERKLNWPSLLFQYTDLGRDKGKTLIPEKDCQITSSGTTLFECNDTWKVIKPRPRQ